MADVMLTSIWEAIHQMKEQISTEVITHLDLKIVRSKWVIVQSGLKDIQQSLNVVTGQVTELQERVNTNEDDMAKLLRRVVTLEEDNAYLKMKVEDLDNRSRRSNLCFVNIPEKSKTTDMVAIVSQKLIPTIFGKENFPTALMVERAHRTSTSYAKSSTGRSRPILVKFANDQDKEKILRLAKEKESLSFGGVPVFIYPDFSPQTVKKRREFDNVKKKLQVAEVKCSLVYPSTLKVLVDGKAKLFRSSKDAEAFLKDLPSTAK